MPDRYDAVELDTILKEIEEGKIVIPEFQRDFIWEPEQVRELLVSIIANYYIGTLIFIEEMMSNTAPFKVKTLKGVKKNVSSIIKIVLDGQQRLTSLYYAINKPDYPLKGRKHPHLFFIDLEKVRNGEWEEAVIAVSKADNERLRNEQKSTIIEFGYLFKSASELYRYVKERTNSEEYASLALNLSDNLKRYKLNIYYIGREKPIETIVEIFDRINSKGTPLSVFDLLVAKLFNHNINLRKLLDDARKQYDFTKVVDGDYIVKTIVLMRGNAPTRKNMLSISPENFTDDFNKACEALELAYRRLLDKKTGYGVLDFKKWVPYETMIVPLATLIRYLKDNRLDNEENYRKLDAWYWISVFGNRYEHSTDTVSWQDYNKMTKWFENGSAIPDFIKEFNPENIEYSTHVQRSAIFRGIVSLIVLKGAKDFITGQSPEYEKEKAQLDHIFPRSKFSMKFGKELVDSVLNRTVITSNQRKIDKKPSEFFTDLINKYGRNRVVEILETHLIPEEALDSMLKDDFVTFVEKRKEAIIREIRRRTLF